MLARRKFLAFLGLGAGAAVAAKVSAPTTPPSAVAIHRRYVGSYHNVPIYETDFKIGYGTKRLMPSDLAGLQSEYNTMRSAQLQSEYNTMRSAQLRFAEAARDWSAVEREKVRFHQFMTGEQWTPEQIAEMHHG